LGLSLEVIEMPAEMTDRRFPPPWTLDEHDECFIVRDANGQA
jgi:hypothetical protein